MEREGADIRPLVPLVLGVRRLGVVLFGNETDFHGGS
jgi:hypothetical protein